MVMSQEDEGYWEELMDQYGPTEDSTYLRPQAALALFDQSEKRVRRGNGWVKVGGRWLRLRRADLLDDVRTGRCWDKRELEDPQMIFAYYRAKIRWGARLAKRSWYSIDSVSDG